MELLPTGSYNDTNKGWDGDESVSGSTYAKLSIIQAKPSIDGRWDAETSGAAFCILCCESV
jgi:hypothetical protein